MRRRVLLVIVGITTLVVLAFAVPVGVLLQSAIVQRAEHATTDQADSVALYIRAANPTGQQIASYVASVSTSTGRPTWVLLPNCTFAGAPPASLLNTPDGAPGDCRAGGGAPAGPGGGGLPRATLNPVGGGQVAEAGVQGENGSYLVRVFVSDAALHAGEAGWWALLIGGSVALLVIGVVAGELLTRWMVGPLVRTADTAQRLSTGDVSARAPTSGPREVAEVGAALNRLADRIDELIAEERETVADLSHRLRTPLTALRLDAEAVRSPDDAERIGAHVTALERTLTDVIRAARRPQREGRLPSADATEVVADRVAFWSALADDQDRGQDVSLPDGPLLVRTSAEDLAAAVDALVENVIAHTPEGTPFAVSLSRLDHGASLVVSDSGPGLPDGAGLRGRSDRGSSGLGLDIARRCAEVSGGSLRVGRSDTGGALITLTLGPP